MPSGIYKRKKPPWNKGLKGVQEPYWLGKKRSKKDRKKMSITRISLGLSGEKHPKWIKDRTQLCRISKQGERRTSIYFFWRKQVWIRDNYKCKINNKDCKGRIEAHHILCWSEHPELRYDINNGITLCQFHHPRVRNEEKRLIPYLKKLVPVSKI